MCQWKKHAQYTSLKLILSYTSQIVSMSDQVQDAVAAAAAANTAGAARPPANLEGLSTDTDSTMDDSQRRIQHGHGKRCRSLSGDSVRPRKRSSGAGLDSQELFSGAGELCRCASDPEFVEGPGADGERLRSISSDPATSGGCSAEPDRDAAEQGDSGQDAGR